MKKIIDRIVLGSGSPNKNDLWIDDRNGLEMKVYDDGEWKPMAGGSGGGGSDSGDDSESTKVAVNIFKLMFHGEQGKISGILKLVSEEPWNYLAWMNNGAIEPLPGDTAVFYDFETMTDDDIAAIRHDIENQGYAYGYMLVRSEPVEDNYGDTHKGLVQELYYDISSETISFGINSNNCYGVKVNGHDCYWYTYYD